MNKFVVVNFGTEEVEFFENFQEVENHIAEYIREADLYNEAEDAIEDFEIYTLPDGDQYFPKIEVSQIVSIK